MRQRRHATVGELKRRRPNAKKSKIGFPRGRRGKPAKGFLVAAQKLLRIVGQITGKNRRFGFTVECFSRYRFAGNRHAKDAGKLLTSAPDDSLAGRTDRRKRNDIDLRAGKLGFCRCILGQTLKDGFKAIMTRVMKMIRLGGGKKYSIDARTQQRAQKRSSSRLKTIENLL